MKANRSFLVYLLAVMFVCCIISGPAQGGPLVVTTLGTSMAMLMLW